MTTTTPSPRSDRVRSLLRSVPLFADLAPEELDHLAGQLHLRTHLPETVLFLEGDVGDRLFLILEGSIAIIKQFGTSDERLVNHRGAGEFIGEMSLLTGDGTRTASARTTTEVRLLELTAADFYQLLDAAPSIARHLLGVQSRRLRDAHDRIIADLHEKNQRLAQAYADLQNAQGQIIEQETLLRELRVASQIQQRMLPQVLPQADGFEIFGTMIPARQVGGDFYDVFALPGGRLGIAVGDVSGKGIPAALFMALSSSLLRAEAVRHEADELPTSPAVTLERLNSHIRDRDARGMFVTVIYGVLDPQRREFSYVRAGHEYPLVWDADGMPRPPDQARAVPIGLFPEVVLDAQTVALPPGTRVLLFTDGVTEALNPANELFGHERLEAVVYRPGDAPAALCDRIIAAVEAHSGGEPQADDITLLAIRAL